jgi:hypothetical protein
MHINMRIAISKDIVRVAADTHNNTVFFLLRDKRCASLKFEEWEEDMETSLPWPIEFSETNRLLRVQGG